MTEKKEIWKLLELLNEYSKNIWYFNEEDLQWQTKAWILSKEFWWVKWLVENDKINILQLDNRIALLMSIEFNKVERVLMALSISDTPIDLLCSLLK